MTGERRYWVLLLALILLGTVAGGVFSPGVEGVAAATGSADQIEAGKKAFAKLYSAVEENFADKVSPDKAIYKGAVPGMLRTLDPHSGFYDPRDFQILREDQRGAYFGIGMAVQERNRRTIVIAPFPGSPAYKAGVRPGDVIVEVDGKRCDTLTSSEVADLLKGPRDTKVVVLIAREGVKNHMRFEITRDEISRKSVEPAIWVKPGIAHLHINQFNENTTKEMEKTLKELGEDKITGLILDLRNNPGGLLNEGVSVAGKFLRKGQLVVSHKGRSSPEKPYYATRGSGGREYPVVVLVNRLSASAAEIVSGALQDHDRALILGENTFGKGLVQTVMPLPENTGLLLTTAKYYTPSGRLIQRDYSSGSFLDYYYKKNLDTKNPLDVKMTDGGRTVHGGGGISPDELFSGPKLTSFQNVLLRRFTFFNFAASYFGSEEAKLARDWTPNESTLQKFREFLKAQEIPYREPEFTEAQDWLKSEIRKELFITAFSQEESRRIAIESDPVVKRALESMPKAKELLESSRKLASRRPGLE
ncbi:MAG: S41 family peptidase [Candidatus Solibacter usitatus]|nr:S41 family peptidase [Candidatus Solibacter usitatus]